MAGLLWLGAAVSAAAELKVVAWNVEWFPGRELEPEPEAAASHMRRARAALARIDPDVFIGSEMRDWQAFADLAGAVSGLRTAVVSAFYSLYQGGFWPQQIGIGSKLPVEAAWAQRWRPTLATNPRGFSFAALKVPGNEGSREVLLVYGVHLKSNRAHSERDARLNVLLRDESAAQLLEHIDEMERLTYKGRIRGVLVGGDFNTNHDGQFGDRAVALLEEAGFRNTWSGVPREKRLTWRGDQDFEPTTLDYIFTKGLGAAEAFVIPVSERTGDHWPVAIRLVLP